MVLTSISKERPPPTHRALTRLNRCTDLALLQLLRRLFWRCLPEIVVWLYSNFVVRHYRSPFALPKRTDGHGEIRGDA